MKMKFIAVFWLLLCSSYTYSPILAEKNVKILKFIDEPSCSNGSNQPIKYANGTFIYLPRPNIYIWFTANILVVIRTKYYRIRAIMTRVSNKGPENLKIWTRTWNFKFKSGQV